MVIVSGDLQNGNQGDPAAIHDDVRERQLQGRGVILGDQELADLARFCRYMQQESAVEGDQPFVDLRRDEFGQLTFLLCMTALGSDGEEYDCQLGPFWVEYGYEEWVRFYQSDEFIAWG